MKSKNLNRILTTGAAILAILYIFPNDYKGFIPYGNIILNIVAALAIVVGYVLYFSKILALIKKNPSFLLPFIIAVISTVINNGDKIIAISWILKILSIFLLCAIFLDSKKRFVNIAESISFFILIINALVVVVVGRPLAYTETAGEIYFIFIGNVGKLLAANMLLFFISRSSKTKHVTALHYALYTLTLYQLSSSATYFTGCLILLVSLFISSIKNKKRTFRQPIAEITCFSILLIACIATVFGFSATTLSEVFNKSMTLSGRTEIWKNSLALIRKHPLFGIGYYSSDFMLQITRVTGATHAHNQLLQIILNSGLISLPIYFFYLMKIIKLKSHNNNDPCYASYMKYLTAIMIMGITTCPFDGFFYLSVLAVTNYRPSLATQSKTLNTKKALNIHA